MSKYIDDAVGLPTSDEELFTYFSEKEETESHWEVQILFLEPDFPMLKLMDGWEPFASFVEPSAQKLAIMTRRKVNG